MRRCAFALWVGSLAVLAGVGASPEIKKGGM